MDKLKLLIFGSIQDEGLFLSKLKSLQKSKAGPFDVAFCVGKSSVVDKILLNEKDELPIPVYLHGTSTPIKESQTAVRVDDNSSANSNKNEPRQIAPNLFVLPSTGIWSLPIKPNKPPLVVVTCPWNVRVDDAVVKSQLLQQVQHVSYRGCDLLLSHEWPQGVEALVEEAQLQKQQQQQLPQPLTSYDVAHVALQARARYHVASGSYFGQSAPFEHLAATTNTVPCFHIGRFLSMPPVVAATTAVTTSKKLSKFVHALGIVPLQASSPAELQAQRPAQVQSCPFTDASYQVVINNQNNSQQQQEHSSTSVTAGLSEASARRILHQEQQQHATTTQAHRWATTRTGSRKRSHHPNQQGTNEEEEEPVDPNNTVLFVHGLHQDVSGRLQMPQTGDALLLRYLQPKGCMAVQRPHATASASFCFLQFASHAAAAAFLQETGGSFDIEGVALTVKWRSSSSGSSKQRKQQQQHHQESNKRPRLTEADAKDSCCVYFKLPPSIAEDARIDAGEALRKWAETTLEDALAPEGGGGDDDRVTAETEPALQVKVRIPKASPHDSSDAGGNNAEAPTMATFGFLDFASHAAASMTLATLTGSTDGGRLLDEAKGIPSDAFQGLYLHWAKDDASKQQQQKEDSERNIIEDTSGFRFERKHFPADARKDCWFCLASEDCEKHLITGVYNSCYAAMPKGPVHPGHLLLIPVKHSSRGALTDPVVAEEMEELKTKLRRHASTAFDRDLFVFERAIQTKHGYHTHVQCIPIERQFGVKLQATMLVQARKLGIELREINSDIGLQALVSGENGDDDGDDGDNEGYFYAEIPAAGLECKRFLYQQKQTDGRRSSIPLQFGREIVAAVLGKPDFAHWKACVVDKEQETAMAAKFRESFASYE